MSPTAQVIKTARVLARAKSHPCLASILSPPCIRKTESYLYLRCILGKCPQRQGPEWHELLLSVEGRGCSPRPLALPPPASVYYENH